MGILSRNNSQILTNFLGFTIGYFGPTRSNPRKTFKNAPDGRVLKSDALVGKNYLSEGDIKKLERTVAAFFDYIDRIRIRPLRLQSSQR